MMTGVVELEPIELEAPPMEWLEPIELEAPPMEWLEEWLET